MTTILLYTIIIYLIGVPIAWFKEYCSMLDHIDQVNKDYPEWHDCCVKWANQECKLSWVSLIIIT